MVRLGSFKPPPPEQWPFLARILVLLFVLALLFAVQAASHFPALGPATVPIITLCSIVVFRVFFASWIAKIFAAEVNAQLVDQSPVLPACGISKIFATRAAAMKDAEPEIVAAKGHLWFLGATLAEGTTIINYLDILQQKARDCSVDVRILLATPLRSPSVYRMLLRAPDAKKRAIMEYYYGKRQDPHTPLDVDEFMHEFDKLLHDVDEKEHLHPRIRFYAQPYSLWAMRIDDSIYFEPVFLPESGINEALVDTHSTGPIMKVKNRSNESKLFRRLENHMDVLWKTSTTRWFYMRKQWSLKELILGNVFAHRKKWFPEVANYYPNERRSSTQLRHPCYGDSWYWVSKDNEATGKCKLIDYSVPKEYAPCKSYDEHIEGLGLEAPRSIASRYRIDDIVTVSPIEDASITNRVVPNARQFTLRYIGNNNKRGRSRISIGLAARRPA